MYKQVWTYKGQNLDLAFSVFKAKIDNSLTLTLNEGWNFLTYFCA